MGNQSTGDFSLVKKLGKGCFGKTRLYQVKQEYRSVKILELKPCVPRKQFIKELTSLYQPLKHKRLLQFHQIIEHEDEDHCLQVVSEYCKDGNLAAHLVQHPDLDQRLLKMQQLARTLLFLHEKNIMHGDIKPNNILLKQGDLVLADIALPSFAKRLRLRDTIGAFDYFPPQYWGGGQCLASDVWSLGLVYLEMCHGKSIRELEHIQEGQKPSKKRQNYPSPDLISNIQCKELSMLIDRMLKKEVEGRIDIKGVLAKLGELSQEKIRQICLQVSNQVQREDEARQKPIPQGVQYLLIKMNQRLPNFNHFSYINNIIKRQDTSINRLQVVSQEKVPPGKWLISVKIMDYGEKNDEVAIGFTTQERRKERMSGDTDQYNSLAFWSNKINETGYFCINGEWSNDSLPYLKPQTGLLQIECNNLNHSIDWFIDGKIVMYTKLPKSLQQQSLYFFAGLLGKNCSIKILSQNQK